MSEVLVGFPVVLLLVFAGSLADVLLLLYSFCAVFPACVMVLQPLSRLLAYTLRSSNRCCTSSNTAAFTLPLIKIVANIFYNHFSL